jgi:class 3 adenylate cyclase
MTETDPCVNWSDVLPTGTVTLLLADVESSTRLWETQPDDMTAAFARLDQALAELVAAHGGTRPVEQGEGDSFVVAFTRASDAVRCALELQRAPLAPIRLRIGLHSGEVQLRGMKAIASGRRSTGRPDCAIWRTAVRRCCPGQPRSSSRTCCRPMRG